jgi:hypothetical protein
MHADDWDEVQDEGWGWAEVFLAVQLLWGAVLFLPGSQAYRTVLRASPYLTSIGALIYYYRRPTGEPLHASGKWLIASLVLLSLNLLHPTAHPMAGVAQIVFQLSIAAPALWMTRSVRSEAKLERLLWIFFASSAASSTLGLLQVYYPETFLPREFSSLGLEMNPNLVSSLTYRGADGRDIVRPPGLSDMPGGAAVAAMQTMALGVLLAFRSGTPVAVGCWDDGAPADAGTLAGPRCQCRRGTLCASPRAAGSRRCRGDEPRLRWWAGGCGLRVGGGCRRAVVVGSVSRTLRRRRGSDLSGRARVVSHLHRVGAALRVSARRGPRALGNDAGALR